MCFFEEMHNFCCAILRHIYTTIICAVENFLNELMRHTIFFFCIDGEEAARHEKRIGNGGDSSDDIIIIIIIITTTSSSSSSCSSKFCASKG